VLRKSLKCRSVRVDPSRWHRKARGSRSLTPEKSTPEGTRGVKSRSISKSIGTISWKGTCGAQYVTSGTEYFGGKRLWSVRNSQTSKSRSRSQSSITRDAWHSIYNSRVQSTSKEKGLWSLKLPNVEVPK
jgi:hypothetical protein